MLRPKPPPRLAEPRAEAAHRVQEQRRGGWRGRWHAENWIRSVERYAFSRVGPRPVSEVTNADVLEILTTIWHVKPETARAVRQRSRAVLEWAIAMELWNDNPCDRADRATDVAAATTGESEDAASSGPTVDSVADSGALKCSGLV